MRPDGALFDLIEGLSTGGGASSRESCVYVLRVPDLERGFGLLLRPFVLREGQCIAHPPLVGTYVAGHSDFNCSKASRHLSWYAS
jgi:hypothetical protein